MPNSDEKNLALHRIDQARECLKMAEATIEASLKTSVNRSYYAIFHAMRAVLALERFDSKKHSGIIAAFRQRYVKTGEFESFYSDIIGSAFEIRNDSDYEDFYVISKPDALKQLENAQAFLEAVEMYLKNFFHK